MEQHGFTVEYITGYQFALAKSQDTAQLNEFEGQMELSVMIEPNPEHAIWEFTSNEYGAIQVAVEQVCEAFGPVRNSVHIQTDDTKMVLVFRVEFYSVDTANRAVQSLTTDAIWGINKEASHVPHVSYDMLTLTQKSYQWVTVNPAMYTGERAINSPHRVQPRVDDQGRIVGYRPALLTAIQAQNLHYHPADQHNRVRRDRILDGSDVRTTIMLRNIPNKMDWVCLSSFHS